MPHESNFPDLRASDGVDTAADPGVFDSKGFPSDNGIPSSSAETTSRKSLDRSDSHVVDRTHDHETCTCVQPRAHHMYTDAPCEAEGGARQ